MERNDFMATEKPRYTVTLDDELFEAVEKYRYEHRISTRSSATVELLKKGMEELYRQEAEDDAKINKAPTEDSAAEALYEVLYFYFGRPPEKGEVNTFRSIIPIICNGIKGSE